MLAALRDEVVLAGWMRASGVLSDVALPRRGRPRRRVGLAARVQVIALEGSVGLAGGDVSCGFRVVLARETEDGARDHRRESRRGDVEALEVIGPRSTTSPRRASSIAPASGCSTRSRARPVAAATVERARRPRRGDRTRGSRSAAAAPQRVMPSPTRGVRRGARAPRTRRRRHRRRRCARLSAAAGRHRRSARQAMPQRIARPVQAETETSPFPSRATSSSTSRSVAARS